MELIVEKMKKNESIIMDIFFRPKKIKKECCNCSHHHAVDLGNFRYEYAYCSITKEKESIKICNRWDSSYCPVSVFVLWYLIAVVIFSIITQDMWLIVSTSILFIWMIVLLPIIPVGLIYLIRVKIIERKYNMKLW